MSGPNHLWSGDWERESAEAAAELAERPALPIEQPTVEASEPEGRPRRRFGARQLLLGIVGGLVLAGIAVALVVSLGGSSKPVTHRQTTTHPSTQPLPFPGSSGGVTPAQSTPTPPQTTPTQTTLPPAASVPTAEWLGMQIVTSPDGAVVDTVRGGSPGDAAGFEPGDVISQIGDDPINSVADIRAATEKLPLGQELKITISRGSSTLTTAMALKVRPTIQP
jgi:membrane-associated protease RseP (regulator of RpoE activity)